MAKAELELSASRAPRYQPWLQRRIEASGLPLAVAGSASALLQHAAFLAIGLASWVGGARRREPRADPPMRGSA
jgi:hypothetical protein